MLQPRRRRRQAEQERRRFRQRQRRHRRRDIHCIGRLQTKNGQLEPMTVKPENRKPIFYEEGFTQIQILFTISSARRCCIVFRVCFVIFVTVKIQH